MAVSVFLKNDNNFVTYLSLDEGYKELKNASCGDGDVMSVVDFSFSLGNRKVYCCRLIGIL